MARLIIYIPEFDSDTALFFFYRGDSWKLRDFSTGREIVVSSNRKSKYTVDKIRSMALHEEEVSAISVKNVEEWKSEIERVNKLLIKSGVMKDLNKSSHPSTALEYQKEKKGEVNQPPWTSGPSEILEHGVSLLAKESDKNRRLAMLTIDNAVELMVKTYLGLPKRATGIKMSRSDYRGICESFPKLLDALEKFAADKLLGINLADLEWYHRLRNQLYHQGNGLTVERDKVIAYAQIAKALFKNLFGFGVPLRDKTSQEPIAAFLNNWGRIERAVITIADQHNLRSSSGIRSHAGPLSLIKGLTKAGIFPKHLEKDLMRFRELRNIIVHQRFGESGSISPQEMERLAEIADETEQICFNVSK